MTEMIRKIVKGVNMPDTVQEGIEQALEKQDKIDKIQTTGQRAIRYLDEKKTIEAGKKEIQKKIEKEYKRKLLENREGRDLAQQKLWDEESGCNRSGVDEAEELRKFLTENIPQEELTKEARQQFIIEYLDGAMQLPEFWMGKIEKPEEKPQKDEIELLETRISQGIKGFLIRNKTTGKKFFVPDLQNLNKNIADKLPASIKLKFKFYHISD